MLNCTKTIERLYPFIDRELSEQELEEIREHLEMCPPCAKHFAFESGVLRFINDVCRSVEAPAALRAKVLSTCTYASETRTTK